MFLCIAHCVKPTDGCQPDKCAKLVRYWRCVKPERCQDPYALFTHLDTNAIGRCTMPEIKSLWISLSIAITTVTEQKFENERQFKGYVRLVWICCVVDFPPCRFAYDLGFSGKSGPNSLTVRTGSSR
jgi:hypothetical protein